MSDPQPSLRALVLAPRGRDGAVAASLIAQADVPCRTCRDLGELVGSLDEGVAFVLMTEEAVRSADLAPLMHWLAAQPAWSDLPFVLVTDHGGGPERNPIAARWLEALGNVAFLERPFHPTTLFSIVRATVKGRRRQHEVRQLVDDLRRGELRLQQTNDQLERRVEERTAQLRQANDELLAEMAERARTEEQLRHMQKLESIGQLTGGVAHDFNNLLTAVLGNLELMRKRLPPESNVERLIDGAMQAARRGASLTQRLLAFARRQALEPRPTDLVELVTGMGDLLRRSLGPGIAMEFALPPGLPAAVADHNQIELALLNLVVNARDAMPDGGRLTIELWEARAVPESDLAAGRYLVLAVRDTGLGMDGETLARAIEPFFSTKEIGKGTGLGLSMIHGLAQQLRGALRLYSAPGRGTLAELWLPAVDVPAAQIAAEPPPVEGARSPRFTLLLVEDDALIALSTKALLEDLGHTVIAASTGMAAVEILAGSQPIDLMITDYAMPGMTGAQLAERARGLRPGLPILLATGYADMPALARLELPRLSKPYHQQQLAEQIALLLA